MPSENIETQRSIPLALYKIIFTTIKLFYKKENILGLLTTFF
jgi:hypothetical protein